MGCRSIFETNILIFHLKRNAGWICPLVDSYQKKCAVGCLAHKFVFEVENIENCNFLSYFEKKNTEEQIRKLKKKMKLNIIVGAIETKLIK